MVGVPLDNGSWIKASPVEQLTGLVYLRGAT